MKIKKTIEEEGNENIFWVTMTDLMLGLVLVFIILFIYSYITGHVDLVQREKAVSKTTEVLKENFKQNNIDATIDPISGIVKISDLELFELNSYELSQKGKESKAG